MVKIVEKTAKPKTRPVTPLGILVQQLEHIVNAANTESISTEFKTSLDRVYQLAVGIEPYLNAVWAC